jgi:ubiquinone/menaquinone biosynthesis C-methylase UbiE
MNAYHGRFYDQYFVGVEGDVEFYADEAQDTGGPVLELGCGTGRILLAVAETGIRTVGLDLADDLLDIARAKLAEASGQMQECAALVKGDMRQFSLDQRFRLVTIPYRTFQHLLTPVDQEQALTCIRDHLEEEGRLVFNTFDPLADLMAEGFRGRMRKDTDFVDRETGNRVVVWYNRQYDPEVQLLEQEIIYEEVDRSDQVVGRTYGQLTLRYASRYEIQYLLELCGFELEALYGDFEGGAYPGFGEQVWVARKV